MVEINNNIKTNFQTTGLEESIEKLIKLNKEKEKLQKDNKIDIEIRNQKLNDLEKDIKSTTQDISRASQSARNLGESIDRVYSSRAQNAFKSFDKDLASLTQQSQKLENTLKRIDDNKLGSTEKTLLATERALKNNNTQLDQLRKNFGISLMQSATFGSINALGDMFGDALQQVKEIDKVLTDIKLVSNKTTEEMKAYSDYAGKAAGALGSTKKELLQGNLIFEQQGGDAAQYAKQYGEQVLIGSNISGESTKDVSEFLTSTMNGMDLINKKGAQAAKYVNDIFGNLGALSGSDYGELAKSQAQFANIASNSGFNLEQTSAMSATISEITRKAPEAVGTALKSILASFQQQTTDKNGEKTSKVEKAFESAGVDIKLRQDNGQMRSAEEIINELGGKWQDLNKDQQGMISSAIAGKHHGESFQALMNNWDRYEELFEDAQNSAGAAMRQQEVYMDSIEAKTNQLKNTWQEYVTSLGASDAFKDLVGLAQGFADQLAAGESSTLNIVKGLTPLVNAFNQFYGKQKFGQMVQDRGINTMLQDKVSEKENQGQNKFATQEYWTANSDRLNDKAKTYVDETLKMIESNNEAIEKITEQKKALQETVDQTSKGLNQLESDLKSLNNEAKLSDKDLVDVLKNNMTLDEEKKDAIFNEVDDFVQLAGRGEDKKNIVGMAVDTGLYNQKQASEIYDNINDANSIIPEKEMNNLREFFTSIDTLNSNNIKGLKTDLEQIVQNRDKLYGKGYIDSLDRGDNTTELYNSLSRLKERIDKLDFNDENQVADATKALKEVQITSNDVADSLNSFELNLEKASQSALQVAESNEKERMAKNFMEKSAGKEDVVQLLNSKKDAIEEEQLKAARQVNEANENISKLESEATGGKKTLKDVGESVERGKDFEKYSGLFTGLAQSGTALIGTFQALQENGMKANEETEKIVSSGLMNFGMGLMSINPLLGSLVMILGPIIDGFNLLTDSVEEAREANKKITEVYLAQNEKINAKQSTLTQNEDILKKYGNMDEAEREGALEGNQADKEKWEGAMQQIAQQYPELVQGTDENGRAIVELKDGYAGLKEELKKEKVENNQMLVNNSGNFGKVIESDMRTSQQDIGKYNQKIKDAQAKLNIAQQVGNSEEIDKQTSAIAKYQEKLNKAQQTLTDTKTSIQTNLINPIFDANKEFANLTGEARKTAIALKGELFNSDTVQSMMDSGTSIETITKNMKGLAKTVSQVAGEPGFNKLKDNLTAEDYIDLQKGNKQGTNAIRRKIKALGDNDKNNDKKYDHNAGLKYAQKETKEYEKQNKVLKEKEKNAEKANKEQQKNQRNNLLNAKTGAPDSAQGHKKEIEVNKEKNKADNELDEAKGMKNLRKAIDNLTPAYAAASKSQKGFEQSSKELTEVLQAQDKATGAEKESLQDSAFAMMSGMAESNDEFFQEWVAGSKNMVKKISELYDVDLTDFQSAAEAKAKIMNKIQMRQGIATQMAASGKYDMSTKKGQKEYKKDLEERTNAASKTVNDLSDKDLKEIKDAQEKDQKKNPKLLPEAIKAGEEFNKDKEKAKKAAQKAQEEAQKEKDEKEEEKPEEKTYNQIQALEKEADKYYAVTEAINDMNRAYDRLKRARDNAYSGDKLAIMEQEEAQLKENLKTSQAAEGIYQQEANRTKSLLAAQGFTFDEGGTIANKNAIMDQMTTSYNNRAMELNGQEQSEEAQQEMENRQQAIQDTEKLVSEYEEANSKLKEQQDSIEDIKQQLSDLQAEKYEVKINIIGDAIDQQAKIIDALNKINETEDNFNEENAERLQTKAKASLSQFEMAKQLYEEVQNDPKLTGAAKEEKMKELTDVMTSSATEAMDSVQAVNDEIDKFINKVKDEFEEINKNVDRIMQKAEDLAEINGKLYGEDSSQYLDQIKNMEKLYDIQDEISRGAIETYKKQQQNLDTSTEAGKKQFQELQDAINSEEDKISENFNKRLDNAQKGMEDLTNKVIQDFDEAGSHIDRALSMLSKLNTGYENVFGNDNPEYFKQQDEVQKMREIQMEHAQDTIKYFKQQQKLINQNTKSGKEQWKQYQDGINAAEDLLTDGLITTLEELNKRMQTINDTVIKSFNKAYEQTNRIIQKTNEYKDAFLQFSGSEFDEDYDNLINNVNNARIEQNKVAQDAIDFYKSQMKLINTTTKAGKEQYEQMQEEINKMGDAIQKNLTDGMKEYESAMKAITSETIKRFDKIASITANIVSKQNNVANMAKQVFGDTSDQYLNSMNESQLMRNDQDKLAQQTIDFYKKQQQELDLTTKAGKEQWQQYQDGIEKAQELISNNLSKALSDLQAQMEAMNKKTLKEFKNAFGTDGLDNLQNEYNMQNKAQEKYLSGLEKANILASKRAEIEEKISHSNNNEEIAMYNKYLQETLVPLENAKTINQHDLDIAQAKLEVAKAELEVRRQGDADMQTRLVRDSQGNMTYEYYQKESQKGQDAIAKYNTALDNLQQKMRETVKSTAQEIQDTFNNMQNIIQKMAETNDAEERKRLQKQLEAYKEYYNQLMQEYQNYSQMFSAEQVQGAFNKLNQGAISSEQLGQSMGVSSSTIDAMNQANQNGLGFSDMMNMSQEDLSGALGISVDEAGAVQSGLQNGGGMDIQSLSAMIQNMYDTWQSKSDETLNKINENFDIFAQKSTDIFNQAYTDVDNYKNSATTAFETLNGSMNNFIEQSLISFETLKEGYQGLADQATTSMGEIDKSVDRSYIKIAEESSAQFKKAANSFANYADIIKTQSSEAFSQASQNFEDYNTNFRKSTDKSLKQINSYYNHFNETASSAAKTVRSQTDKLTSSSHSLENQLYKQQKASDKVRSSAVETENKLYHLKKQNEDLASVIRNKVNTAFTGNSEGTGKKGMFGAMVKNSDYAKGQYRDALNKANKGTGTLSDSTNTMAKKFGYARDTMSEAYGQAIKFDTDNAKQGKKVKDGIDKIAASTKTLGKNAANTADAANAMVDAFDRLNGGKGSSSKKTSKKDLEKLNGDIAMHEATKYLHLDKFDTGGYTGEWTNSGNNKEGRMAMLHEKELVLNAEDTQNILKTVSLQREMAQFTRMSTPQTPINNQPTQQIEQKVEINADFPNANNREEIVEAFNGMKARAISYISNPNNE